MRRAKYKHLASYLDRGKWRRYTYIFVTTLIKQAKQYE